MIVVDIPTMQLQDELFPVHEAFIFIPAMSAGAAKQLLIPSADCLDIMNANEGC
jgi:hypothetical protein